MMRSKILFALAALWTTVCHASPPNCHVEHFSRELLSRYVEYIAQDHSGFIYLGTRNGLCRYDGHEFRFFKSYAGDACRLSSNRINYIRVSSTNLVWCIAQDQRCYLFDPDTERFYDPLATMAHELGKIPFSEQVYILPNGITYIACKGHAIRVDEKALGENFDQTEALTIYPLCDEGLVGSTIVDVVADSNNNEWLLTDQRVYQFGSVKRTDQLGPASICTTSEAVWVAEAGGRIARYSLRAIEPQYLHMPVAHGRIRNIESIGDNELAISTDRGLSICYVAQNRFEFIPIDGGNVNRCYRDSHDALWIFSDREGVWRWDLKREELQHLKNQAGDNLQENENVNFWYEDAEGRVYVVPTQGVFSYYDQEHKRLELLHSVDSKLPYKGHTRGYLVDHQSNIWCAEVEGVSRLSIIPGSFRHLDLNYSADTRAFLCDSHNRLWVSSRNSIIQLFDRNLNRIGYLREDGHVVNTPCSFGAPAYCFHEDANGVIWVGSRFEGLSRLTPIDNNQYYIERFRHNPSDPWSLSDNNIYDICRDRYGRLWIATYGGGLNLASEDEEGHLRFIHSGNGLPFPTEAAMQLRTLQEIEGWMFIGTTDGLVTFRTDFSSPEAITFNHYTISEDDVEGLLSNDIRDIHLTSSGEIFLLTFSGGLNRVQINEEGALDFSNLTQKEGLPSDQVLAMIEDAHRGQWIITETVAFRFDIETNHFETYGERYSNEKYYYSEAKPVLYGDHLLAGTSDGFCTIPTSEVVSHFIPPIVLTELKVEGRTLRQGVGHLRELHLDSDERDLQITFSALDYVNPTAIRYAYRLEGVHNSWQQLGKQHNIHFVDLDTGDYNLLIRSTNSNGQWNNEPYRLHIVVAPTFWETRWAWILYALSLILAMLIPVYIFRLRSQIEMEQRMSDIKLRFFTDISHELRTPLTLITAPIDMLLGREKLSDKGQQQLMTIRHNTERLLSLVNQILDFRKIENRKMRLVVESGDLLAIIRQVMHHFDLLAEKHHIDYALDCDMEHLAGWFDRDKLEKILFNLLSNAFKYTPDGKRITVGVSVIDRRVVLEVIDEGIGFDDSVRKRLFQRFETLSQANLFKPSSGIGLSLVHELVMLHKGTIEVSSTPGIGSRFTVCLPIEQADFSSLDQVDFLLDNGCRGDNEEKDVMAPQTFDQALAAIEELDTRPTILVVEDNDELRAMMCSILSEEYQVFEARQGKEGLHLAHKWQPDLIVSDVVMPIMDGLEMVRRLKEDPATAHQIIVLLSAKTSLDDRILGLEQGVDDYIAKPFHASYLLARLRSLLERRRELQQRLLTQLVASQNIEEQGEPISSEVRFLHDATRIIEAHIDDCEWTIESFAAEMCLSHTLLFQKVKSAVGLSPIEFIREVRLKRACELIADGHHNIATVSYMVGFSDPKYFTRVFKKRFGVPPSKYGE